MKWNCVTVCVFVSYLETVGEDTGFSVLDSFASGDAAAAAAAVTANKHSVGAHALQVHTSQLQLQIKVRKRGTGEVM